MSADSNGSPNDTHAGQDVKDEKPPPSPPTAEPPAADPPASDPGASETALHDRSDSGSAKTTAGEPGPSSPTVPETTPTAADDSSAQGGEGAGKSSTEGSQGDGDKPPAWVTNVMADFQDGAEASTAAPAAAESVEDGAAERADDSTAPTLLAPAKARYAIQTQRALPTPKAQQLFSRFDRPPMNPVLVPAPDSNAASGADHHYLRFTGFTTRDEAARIARRIEPAMRERLTVIRVASEPDS